MNPARLVVRFVLSVLAPALVCFAPAAAWAQAPSAAMGGVALYRALKAFSPNGAVVRVENLAFARDRAQMVFTGTFYFVPPINGRVTGAVFVGQGTFRAEVPPSRFEQDNVRRLLHTTVIESDFKTAVLRFSDDTYDVIGKAAAPAQPAQAGGSFAVMDAQAVRLASEFEGQMLRETGANIAARLAVSLVNRETPGFFVAQFDKGRRGRFACLLDYQSRIPVANFEIDGGEKGVIFTYNADYFMTDVWMAFYGLDDYSRGRVSYSDAFNLVDVVHYEMDVDLRDPRKVLSVTARMDLKPRFGGISAVPFRLSENLTAYHDDRLKLGMRIKSAKLVGGGAIDFAQEDWEGGFTLFLPASYQKDQRLTVEVVVAGDFLRNIEDAYGNAYPLSNEAWYPRHGYLQRSTFDLTFHHAKNLKVASVGERLRESLADGKTDEMVTQFALDVPVALVTFALGPFERFTEMNPATEGPSLPVEFYAMPQSIQRIQTPFMLAEMKNAINYFSALFGRYPFPVFRAALHPFGFGQGFPTLLMIPPTDSADKQTFKFIAHETSHQWWGHMILWRSYRDQWLSEGFAEYSGILYATARDRPQSGRELLEDARQSLVNPPLMALGVGSGRLTDVGPIIMGHRLATRETVNAYSTLIYNKGALIVRMLHFLFTDPTSGKGQPFFDMMTDFVRRYNGTSVTTDDFIAVANEHFARTPIAQRLGLQDLNWFFSQWVFQTTLPSYRMEYTMESSGDGAYVVKGTVFQTGIPEGEKWFMPLPVMINFGGNKKGRALVYALGPETPFSLKIPAKPDSVELDPELWVLSEKTTTKKR